MVTALAWVWVLATALPPMEGATVLRRKLEDVSPCATVNTKSSSAWKEDPHAEETAIRMAMEDPDAPPVKRCYNKKCFNYQVDVPNWKAYSLVQITWKEKVRIDALYGADMERESGESTVLS